ncbi:erythromycin esterase family protein [Streptomyces sp. NPDC007100]|uniref:erythromycin esterase family protein n=1 Tax=Streptomyces sp. NPDC007100 TaxID=3155602 RepID=UPI0034082BE3
MTDNASTVRLSGAAVLPLRTLDPTGPWEDLGWLDEVIGDARVVAIGESAHYNREFFQLRHRLLRYLVERHGFGAYAMETGFVESRLVDDWVRGGAEPLGQTMAHGMTSLMGMWTQMRRHLEWMRRHNATAERPVGFYGIDLPGSAASLLPGLDVVLSFLAQADPEFRPDPGIRETASSYAAESAFSGPAAFASYGQLTPERRDALTANLADLAQRMRGRRLDYVRRTTAEAYERALHALHLTISLDSTVRGMTRGDRSAMFFHRDAALADTVAWVLHREDRIVLAAHNGHVQRWPVSMPGLPPATQMGMHLADRLGADYRVIGTTSGTGHILNTGPDFYTGTLFTEMEAPRPGSLDALMAASHDGPFAADLRRLAPADEALVRTVAQQRAGMGAFYGDQSPLDAYDAIIHLPHVSPADPDPTALAYAPGEVQKPFAQWNGGG